ncbi:MAG: rhomboid family intramembrane serine protease [Bacteroidetes bacterium]|nr:rhomboid family intramembrane serine protease [Bacteroidota bacterium]
MRDENNIVSSVTVPLLFLGLIWIIHIIHPFIDVDWATYGILPRQLNGIKGILFSPLIHGNYKHLISNSVPLLLLGTATYYFYPRVATKVIVLIYLLGGLLVWLFAWKEGTYHIGASGLVYGFACFIFVSGILRRDTKSLGIALIVAFLYGSLVWGVFPGAKGISWESHLYGAVVGGILAFVYKNVDRLRYDWQDEDDDDQYINTPLGF